jgi:hypothetical protein
VQDRNTVGMAELFADPGRQRCGADTACSRGMSSAAAPRDYITSAS